MTRGALIALPAALLAALLTAVPGAAQERRYGAWPGAAPGGTLEELVAELRRLTREAEQARAADPRFLRDLEDLADRYDAPRQSELLYDDFRDGDLLRAPPWTVLRGSFEADPRRGLVLDPGAVATPPGPAGSDEGARDPGAELAMALLSSLINQDRGAGAAPPAGPPRDGVLFTPADIPNAFTLRTRVVVTEAAGGVEFGVFQGEPDGPGYRLAVAPGPQGVVELVRVGSTGAAVIERATAAIRGAVDLDWARDGDGRMTVSVAGAPLFTSTDRAFKSPFIGLQVRHLGGGYEVREITLLGASR